VGTGKGHGVLEVGCGEAGCAGFGGWVAASADVAQCYADPALAKPESGWL